MTLEEQLEKAQQAIATDSYSMSIGELISSYITQDMEVHPEFQRFFRWSDFQRTRLIESFLLGLPIPPIFVYQQGNGKWELIDGLQRVSTILQFAGELKTKNGEPLPGLVLTQSKYLPKLEGVAWKQGTEGATAVFPDALKLKFRKARIDVKIILSKSSEISKFELFDRLNTGGSQATPQEVRNCLVLMQDPTFFQWLDDLSGYPSFDQTLSLTDRQKQEQYNLEILVRFLVLQQTTPDEARRIPDLETYLNEKILKMAADPNFDRNAAADVFRQTFDILNELYGDSVFKRQKVQNGQTSSGGPFLLAAFEIIALGVATNIVNVRAQGSEWVRGRISELWSQELVKSIGLRASQRLAHTIPLARSHFA
jgi:hypothetical protein